MTDIEEWIASRPACVQKLITEFPLGSTFYMNEKVMYLLGYTEGDMLIVTPVNPSRNYEKANACKEYVCASHFRKY